MEHTFGLKNLQTGKIEMVKIAMAEEIAELNREMEDENLVWVEM